MQPDGISETKMELILEKKKGKLKEQENVTHELEVVFILS